MIFGFLTLFIALCIAGVAGWFSIVGLMAIFSASAVPIAIMAGTLEVGKLVAASWLYRYWSDTKWWMKTYLTVAVLVLMLITSMGIFGYLSKAHLDQEAEGGNNELQMAQIQLRIDREQRKIDDANTVITQLDQAVQTLIDYDRIRGPQGSIAVRQGQAEERAQLNSIVDSATDQIANYQDQLLPLQQAQMQVELKVGPLKYVAELIYGESAESTLDKAVRLFILLLVFVFDPLAIIMVIAANQTLLRYGINLEKSGPENDDTHKPNSTDSVDAQSDCHRDITAEPASDSQVVEAPVSSTGDSVAVQQQGALDSNSSDKHKPSSVDDAAIAMMESASQKKRIQDLEKENKKLNTQLNRKPKTVEVIKEVPVEKIVEVEKVIESKKLKDDNAQLKRKIRELQKQLQKQPDIIEKVVEVEKQVPVEVEKAATGDLQEAARLLASSEFNKEDLNESEIMDMLQKSSEEDVKRKFGFWAMPLPNNDSEQSGNKKFIGKHR